MSDVKKGFTDKKDFWKWLLYSLLGIYLTGIGYGFISSTHNEVELKTQKAKIEKLETICEDIQIEKADVKFVDEKNENIMSGLVSNNEKLDKMLNIITNIANEQKNQNIKQNVILNHVKGAKQEIEKLNERGVFNKDHSDLIKRTIKQDSTVIIVNEPDSLTTIKTPSKINNFPILNNFAFLYGIKSLF